MTMKKGNLSMSDYALALLAQRRQLLRTALQAQIDAGTLAPRVVDYIDDLYARHRDFEAERVAGLALWVGKARVPAWRETCFEGFGTFLQSIRTVLRGLAALQASDTREGDGTPHDDCLTPTGLSPMLATRWCHLGRCRMPPTPENLRERGNQVQQLVQWVGGPTTLADVGLPVGASPSLITPSLGVIEQAGHDALQAMQTVSRCLWQVWTQRAWGSVATSSNDFLEHEIGVGAELGAALIALGQDDTMWSALPRPLGRLAVVVTLLARATTSTVGTRPEQLGGVYE
jgi:hypothetical protein